MDALYNPDHQTCLRIYKKGGIPPTQIFQKNKNLVLLIHWEKRHMN